jgi:hypothetical protein
MSLKSTKALFEALKSSKLNGLRIPASIGQLKGMGEVYGRKTVIYLHPNTVQDSLSWAQELQEKGFTVHKHSYITSAPGGRWNPNTMAYEGPTREVPRLEIQVSYFKGKGWDE